MDDFTMAYIKRVDDTYVIHADKIKRMIELMDEMLSICDTGENFIPIVIPSSLHSQMTLQLGRLRNKFEIASSGVYSDSKKDLTTAPGRKKTKEDDVKMYE